MNPVLCILFVVVHFFSTTLDSIRDVKNVVDSRVDSVRKVSKDGIDKKSVTPSVVVGGVESVCKDLKKVGTCGVNLILDGVVLTQTDFRKKLPCKVFSFLDGDAETAGAIPSV